MKTTTEKINKLIGLYQFKSPYHDDKRKLPFEVIGSSYNNEFPVKVKTVEYKGYTEINHVGEYKIESIEDYIRTGFLVKVKTPNLNPLFMDQVVNFAHLITVEPKTKTMFLNELKSTYDTNNPKTQLFYLSVEKSSFDTIRLSNTRSQILFNH